MDAPEKVARQRLSVLELAEQLGNAAEACRRRGMDRTSFYEWKRRFQLEGLAGLKYPYAGCRLVGSAHTVQVSSTLIRQ